LKWDSEIVFSGSFIGSLNEVFSITPVYFNKKMESILPRLL